MVTIQAPRIPLRFTKKRVVHFWGQDYDVVPMAAKEHIGDGRLLLAFQPMNTRPDYYLVRIDSKTDLNSDTFLEEVIEEIYELLIDQFGEKENERECLAEDLRAQGIEPNEGNTDLDGNEDRLGWPVVDTEGASWWIMARFENGKWHERTR